MPPSPAQMFNKVLMLLDRNENDRAEAPLREAIKLADSTGDYATSIRASCCLGEVLIETERVGDAIPFLERVAPYAAPPEMDDLFDFEKRTAADRLARIRQP